uniref:Uncharacterized protein n=1 Tax=Anopheles albimanus TaxID=7167 RepID=A0A182FKM0_ANOAL
MTGGESNHPAAQFHRAIRTANNDDDRNETSETSQQTGRRLLRPQDERDETESKNPPSRGSAFPSGRPRECLVCAPAKVFQTELQSVYNPGVPVGRASFAAAAAAAGCADPHQMQMAAASRMAYFNAHAAVAAAFLPHNIAASAAAAGGGSLQLHSAQSANKYGHLFRVKDLGYYRLGHDFLYSWFDP